MSTQSACARLSANRDGSCEAPVRKFDQCAVIINKDDILTYTENVPAGGTCEYSCEFTLKDGATGYSISGPEAGSSFFGSFDKARGDLGYAEYIHNTSILMSGLDEAGMCILDALDKGKFVVAMRLTDGTVIVYGLVNGLTTGDYTYDPQAGGGGAPILLSSLADAPEARVPYIYKSATENGESADFDSLFANSASS